MVQERDDTEVLKKFVTDNSLFFIRIKSFSLDKFEDMLCKSRYKNDPVKKLARINEWLHSKIKCSDKERIFSYSEMEKAHDDFKNYLFKEYL